MSRKTHWEQVYSTTPPDALSWYQPSPTRSLELLDSIGLSAASSVIDVGGGDSTFVDGLLDRGVTRITVVDVSAAALERARQRLGVSGGNVTWIEGDITEVNLGEQAFDFWHDRAVFHFLTDAEDRARYVRAAARALAPGGALLIATFALDGPERCSGLPVMRYGATELAAAFAPAFVLETALSADHVTPRGATQRFTYAVLRPRPR